jgi:hypothetical protein
MECLEVGLSHCPPEMPAPTSGFKGGGDPLGRATLVTPAPASTIDCIGMALNNLAFAELNDTTVLQQLTTANLALTASVATLTTSNKKLAEVLAKKQRLQRQRVVGGHVQQTRLSQVIIAGHTGSQPTPHECNLWEQGCGAQG